jgi:hypothetical protein
VIVKPTHQLLSLPEFVARWQGSTLSERSAAQSHFIDLCNVLGQPTPAAADQTGAFYTFEKGVQKTSGGNGFADVWLRGHFAWEYKGKHKDLDAAYKQLLNYREDLENPPLLVVCDLDRFQIHTNFTGTAKFVYAFDLEQLETGAPVGPEGITDLDVLRTLFVNPERLRPDRTAAEVTEAAAREFAKLAESLRTRGYGAVQSAHFLMRLTFCLFAEDIGLLPDSLFTKLVENTRSRPAQFGERLARLFEAMARGGSFGFDDIPHFNGGLFVDESVLELTSEDLSALLTACRLDWASVEPAIFGTLFERSLDPDKRSQLGAHYTSKDDILLIVEPTLLAPLRREWEVVKGQAAPIVDKIKAAKGAQQTRYQRDLERLLLSFSDRIAAVRVLDPACGSGNFLYVSLKQLLDLEKQVIAFAATNGTSGFFPQVQPEQLHGIELNEYAFELAQVVIWIGYIQWLHDNGFGTPSEPILKPLNAIERRDAILTRTVDGGVEEPEWPIADVIVSNPPFLGGNKIRHGLGDEYVNDLFRLYEGRLPHFADLVCYWFEHARELLVKGRLIRAGMLATQGIRGGANRKVLERIKTSGDIFWAQSDRDWLLEGAAVNVSMIGFDNGSETRRELDGREVPRINADLTAATDVTTAVPLRENRGVCFMGPSPKAPFDIDESIAREMLAAAANVNGRPNSDVVRPVASAVDLVQKSRHKWSIDFAQMPLDEASEYELPFEYVKRYVLPVRNEGRRALYAGNWWQYARPRVEMRRALIGKSRYLATPAVAKHRIFVWIDPVVLCNQGTLVFARDDDYFFGVVQSRVHSVWALQLGTALEERPRYTPTTTFETFPFPWPLGQEPMDDVRVHAISEAARGLDEKRNR